MKVRLFEEYSSDYYQELTLHILRNLTYEKELDFTESELNRIKDHVVNRYKELPEYKLEQITMSTRHTGDDMSFYRDSFRLFPWDYGKFFNHGEGSDEIIRLRFHLRVTSLLSGYRRYEDDVDLINIDIYKIKDEWYLVSISHDGISGCGEFKCDQLDGLFKFIDDYHPHLCPNPVVWAVNKKST